MKKWLLTLLMLTVAGSVFAGDSGLYYDQLRDGEGILMLQNKDTYVVYFFTYGSHGCYYDVASDSDKEEICDYNGQRWFYAVVEPDDEVTPQSVDEMGGTMYITHGINYPEGQPHDFIPFIHNVGENIAIGKFGLRRNVGGWLMDVAPTSDFLDVDDPIFKRIFTFGTQLFDVVETDINPK